MQISLFLDLPESVPVHIHENSLKKREPEEEVAESCQYGFDDIGLSLS